MSTVICNNSFSVESIDIDECVGLSLSKINSNYENLVIENCLTHEELQIINNDFLELSANTISLSTLKLQNVYSKAWVNFDGTKTPPQVLSTNGIVNVQKHAPGIYGLSFSTAFSNSNYCLIGTAKQVSATPCFIQYSPTTPFTPTSASINIMTPTGTTVDSEHVSIIIYSE